MKYTLQKEVSAPCALLNGSEEEKAHRIALARNLFLQLCPNGTKIAKVVFLAKRGKEIYKCLWRIEYCQDGNAQLTEEQLRAFIPREIPENTRIVKVETLAKTPLHIAVDYLVVTCKCGPPESKRKKLKVTKLEYNENIKNNHINLPVMSPSLFMQMEIMITLNLSANPMAELFKTLKINSWQKKQLENWLMEGFQDSLLCKFNLLKSYEEIAFTRMSHARGLEYPTLLHFAARFGLERFAFQILECPESVIACQINNKYGMTPAQGAKGDGRLELAMMITRYTNLNHFCNIYIKLEEISLKLNKKDPKSILALHEAIFPLPHFHLTITFNRLNIHLPTYLGSIDPQQFSYFHNFHLPAKSAKIPQKIDVPQKYSIFSDKFQEKLLLVIDDFRTNVQSNVGIRKLVEDWSNRNNEQKSFEEKQEQLTKMSLRYEKIQKEMMELYKRLPLAKTKKLFKDINFSDVKQEFWRDFDMSGLTGSLSGCSSPPTQLNNAEPKNLLNSQSQDDLPNGSTLEKSCAPVPAHKPVKTELFDNKSVLLEPVKIKHVPFSIHHDFILRFL